MIKGLVGSGPTLPTPVQDSKDWESKGKGEEFSDVLDAKASPVREDMKTREPERVQRATEKKSSEDSKEPKDTKTSKAPDPKVMDPKTSAQRQRAIRKFMDSFEGEFGIPPQMMVEAMSQLSAQDLEQPPEKTAETVLSELKLDPQDQAKAKTMYMGLLTQLKQLDVRSDLPKTTDNLLSQLSSQRLQLSSDKKEHLASQVQAMSDKFFMKGQAKDHVVQNGNDPEVMELLKKVVNENSLQQPVMDAEGKPVVVAPLMMQPQQAQKAVTGSTDQLLAQLRKQIMPEGSAEGEDSDILAELGLEKIAFTPDTMVLDKPMALPQQEMQGFEQQPELTPEQMQMMQLMEKEAAPTESFKKHVMKSLGETKKAGETESLDLKSLQLGDLSQLSLKKDFDLAPMSMAKQFEVPVVTEQAKAENVQNIMNQAQILMKKGGGEMNVEMTPEGLGSIQMKLQVLDGKVQLQMNTESKEAKKMIESSMNDLKQSLAAHQLSMDHVKVDVVNNVTQTSDPRNDLQNQMNNFFQQQQREGTQKFWQQFNGEFGNRQARENYFDAGNIRTGSKKQELPGIGESTSAAGRMTGSRGRSLNLVA